MASRRPAASRRFIIHNSSFILAFTVSIAFRRFSGFPPSKGRRMSGKGIAECTCIRRRFIIHNSSFILAFTVSIAFRRFPDSALVIPCLLIIGVLGVSIAFRRFPDSARQTARSPPTSSEKSLHCLSAVSRLSPFARTTGILPSMNCLHCLSAVSRLSPGGGAVTPSHGSRCLHCLSAVSRLSPWSCLNIRERRQRVSIAFRRFPDSAHTNGTAEWLASSTESPLPFGGFPTQPVEQRGLVSIRVVSPLPFGGFPTQPSDIRSDFRNRGAHVSIAFRRFPDSAPVAMPVRKNPNRDCLHCLSAVSRLSPPPTRKRPFNFDLSPLPFGGFPTQPIDLPVQLSCRLESCLHCLSAVSRSARPLWPHI